MKRHQLSLDDLVSGLEYFGDRYEALDVFTRDLQELGRGLMERRTGESWRAKDDSAFVFERGGRSYKLRFHPCPDCIFQVGQRQVLQLFGDR